MGLLDQVGSCFLWWGVYATEEGRAGEGEKGWAMAVGEVTHILEDYSAVVPQALPKTKKCVGPPLLLFRD